MLGGIQTGSARSAVLLTLVLPCRGVTGQGAAPMVVGRHFHLRKAPPAWNYGCEGNLITPLQYRHFRSSSHPTAAGSRKMRLVRLPTREP